MLTAFEAAARLSSFSKAASELNVTQPAVSKQIKSLEAYIGRRLFLRAHRAIELTEAGDILAKAVSRSFGLISDAIHVVADTPEREELVISSLAAFANLWLAPRLARFQTLNPNISVRLVAHDNPMNANLTDGSVDVAIRFGHGKWSDGQATRLYNDTIFPVCSPGFAENAGPIDTLDDLVKHRLVSYDKLEEDWFGWNDWLHASGYDGPPARPHARYSNYSDAILATVNGQGIALGWQALVQGHIDRSELVRVGSREIRVPSARYSVVSSARGERPHIRAFNSWLCKETEPLR